MSELTVQEAALAWAQGKMVEAKHKTLGEWTTVEPVGKECCHTYSAGVFGDCAHKYQFRLVHEPPAKKWRAWTAEEVPVGAVTRPKYGGDVLMIVGRFSNGALLAGDGGIYPFDDLLERREHSIDHGKTWLLCGVKVAE